MAGLKEISDAEFQAEVVESDLPVIVDFWAPWCGPCRTVSKVLEGVAEQRQDLKIVKINIDDNTKQAIANGVMILPTVILFKDGKPLGKLQGGVPPKHITSLIEAHLGAAD
ncbi:MAG: thioredoxin [Chloroflexota bacterium]